MQIAPHWALCVILGAYFSMQIAAPAAIIG